MPFETGKLRFARKATKAVRPVEEEPIDGVGQFDFSDANNSGLVALLEDF